MAALAGGIVWIQKGPGVAARKDLASTTLAQIDNTQGTNGTYINGRGKPDAAEVLLPMPYKTFNDPLRGAVQAHRGPGELLYIAVNDTTADTFDYDGANNLELHEEVINVQTGERRHETWQFGDIFQTVTQGGLAAADVAMVVGQKIPIMAIRPLGPNEYGRLYGFVNVTTVKV